MATSNDNVKLFLQKLQSKKENYEKNIGDLGKEILKINDDIELKQKILYICGKLHEVVYDRNGMIYCNAAKVMLQFFTGIQSNNDFKYSIILENLNGTDIPIVWIVLLYYHYIIITKNGDYDKNYRFLDGDWYRFELFFKWFEILHKFDNYDIWKILKMTNNTTEEIKNYTNKIKYYILHDNFIDNIPHDIKENDYSYINQKKLMQMYLDLSKLSGVMISFFNKGDGEIPYENEFFVFNEFSNDIEAAENDANEFIKNFGGKIKDKFTNAPQDIIDYITNMLLLMQLTIKHQLVTKEIENINVYYTIFDNTTLYVNFNTTLWDPYEQNITGINYYELALKFMMEQMNKVQESIVFLEKQHNTNDVIKVDNVYKFNDKFMLYLKWHVISAMMLDQKPNSFFTLNNDFANNFKTKYLSNYFDNFDFDKKNEMLNKFIAGGPAEVMFNLSNQS